MFRKILALLFLFLLAVGVWYSARWVKHREDLHVTVIFDHPSKLRRGSPCRAGGEVIGRVTRVSELEGQTAISVRIDQQRRNEVLSDSLFDESGSGASAALLADNGFAVGPPLADGAVIHATEGKLARWIATHGRKLGPAAEKIRRSASELVLRARQEDWRGDFANWSSQVPEWKKQGAEVYDEKMAAASAKVDAVEQQLREARKNVEADRLRAEFNEWLERVKTEK